MGMAELAPTVCDPMNRMVAGLEGDRRGAGMLPAAVTGPVGG